MAYATRRSSGGWTTIAPRTDYANVVANYAAVIRQAQIEQKNTEMESKVFAYKNGQLSYEDLKKYLADSLIQELSGSQKELGIRQLQVELDNYEDNKNKDIERAKMEAQFASNGISASERVQIEESLLRFYKDGTPEYTNQLSTIATAKELQRVDQKNAKIAQIESRLSESGLTNREKISLYEQAKGMTEKGTAEYSNLQTKINDIKVLQKEEENKKKLNQVQTALIDKYSSGGLTNDEKLLMNKELQKYVEKDSQDFVNLKENEAALLGAIADEKKVAGNKGVEDSRRTAAIEFNKSNVELEAIEGRFSIDVNMSEEEYMAAKEQILNNQNKIITNLGKAASEEETAQMQFEIQKFLELKNAVQTGQAAVVKDKEGKKAIRLLKELGGYIQTEKVASLDQIEGNIAASYEEKPVVTIVENGVDKKYVVNTDGKFELLSGQVKSRDVTGKDVAVYKATGQISTSVGIQKKVEVPEFGFTPVPTSNFTPVPSSTTVTSGGSKVSTPKPTTSSNKKSTSNITSSTKPNAVASTISAITNITKAIRSSGPGNAYGATTKTGTIKPGNIRGTLDFGITERLGIGKKVTSAINWARSLFKRK